GQFHGMSRYPCYLNKLKSATADINRSVKYQLITEKINSSGVRVYPINEQRNCLLISENKYRAAGRIRNISTYR
ncbi:hypothetical protein, partial [Salmonella enterica]|uniref:hypothetical protein n=1 Tax=Salmonella enterica TaxID=28901 RepID=UPI001D023111